MKLLNPAQKSSQKYNEKNSKSTNEAIQILQ